MQEDHDNQEKYVIISISLSPFFSNPLLYKLLRLQWFKHFKCFAIASTMDTSKELTTRSFQFQDFEFTKLLGKGNYGKVS